MFQLDHFLQLCFHQVDHLQLYLFCRGARISYRDSSSLDCEFRVFQLPQA